ncbi:hypothetical protein [Haloferax sp. Q22]|uniref:hypothetical protein n=1 Tax=Haloferax sp. (strain Q22) TaxID=1526048 RepID=UPI000737B4EB|nr:hypothetical protein [Haloferax sp. Q22]
MRRRTFLATVPLVGTAGCISVNLGTSGESGLVDESEPADDGNTSTDQTTTTEQVDATERPVIHDLRLQADDEWLMASRRYEVLNPSTDSFTVIEQWHITDSDGAEVMDRDRERTLEPERDTETVVESSMWFINRWDHNMQAGEYTVELVVVGPQGEESDPVRRSISITSELSGEDES